LTRRGKVRGDIERFVKSACAGRGKEAGHQKERNAHGIKNRKLTIDSVPVSRAVNCLMDSQASKSWR